MAGIVLRNENMTRSEFVLAVLATAEGNALTPVQVQKLFFVLDRRIPEAMEGPRFSFTPYDYGPFDADVYREIESLAELDLAEVIKPGPFSMKTFRLTPQGQAKGDGIFAIRDQWTLFRTTDLPAIISAFDAESWLWA
jgi:hypothetical protein